MPTLSYDGTIEAEASDVGYWKLADAPGSGTAADSKGSAPLTPGAGVTFGDAATPAGITGTSALLDGGGTSYLHAGPTPVPLAASATLEFWFLPTNATPTHQNLVHNGQVGSDGYGVIYNYGGGGDLYVTYNAVADYGVPGLTVTPGVWHHVMLVIDASGHGTLYFDGVLTSVAATGTPVTPTNLWLGYPNFQGNLAAVALYDSALDGSVAAAHYALGGTAPTPPPPSDASGAALGAVLSWN